MNDKTILILVIIEAAGLIITLTGFSIAVYLTIKANRNVKLMKEKAQHFKSAFENFTNDLKSI